MSWKRSSLRRLEKGDLLNHKKRIDKLFAPKEIKPKRIVLNEYVRERIAELKPLFSHRQVDLISHLEKVRPICMPLDPLQKIIDGLVKNAIENTPDESKVEIIVREKEGERELVVHDYGVGIIEDAQKRII